MNGLRSTQTLRRTAEQHSVYDIDLPLIPPHSLNFRTLQPVCPNTNKVRMCRTTSLTYKVCLHTRVDHQLCSKSPGILDIFQEACNDELSEFNIDGFCLTCREFWDGQRRELNHKFRTVNGYYGPMTPVVKADGSIDFHMDGYGVQQLHAAGSFVTGDDLDVALEGQQPQSPRSRRGSASSTSTIWPSRIDEVVERCEFGYEVGLENVTVPAVAHLARHRPIHLDEFEVANFNESLPRQVEVDGFESQSVLRPPAPVIIAISHRFSGQQA
ncbi:hypothetical protein BKA61DRAFT_102421 [Leptodontidium sp. MPI-SDFR-AT-0119]|nr:hypothetical protein BKA61DRAFT_102421 [Leptodontidium sp. MPI-SDFR-AT-0119]